MLGAPRSLPFFAQRRDAVLFQIELFQPGVEAEEAVLSPFGPLALRPFHVVVADDREKEEPREAKEIDWRSLSRDEPVRSLQTENQGDEKDDDLARERERREPTEHEVEALPIRARAPGELDDQIDTAGQKDE